MLQKSLGRFIRVAALLTIGLASGGVAQAQKATSAAAQSGPVIAGRTVTSIVVLQGGNPAGDLRKVEPTRWVEFDSAGVAVSDYEETKRDDTTVTLIDRSRGVTLVVDMKLNKVNYSDASTRRRELYQIASWDSKPVAEQERVSLVELRREGGAGPMSGRRTDYTPPPPPPPQFCWNERATRVGGTIPGRIADCPSGYSMNNGACSRAAETVAAASRAADCPAGYTNKGNSCERPATTKPNPSSRPADCPDGFKNTGDACFRLSSPEPLGMNSMTCKAGETKLESRCLKACEAGFTMNGGNCVRAISTVGAESMTCKAGFNKSASGDRCIAQCAAGFTNNGDACVRPGATLGIEAMTCKAGEVKKGGRCVAAGSGCAKGEVLQGGLCYAACAPGYEGVGSMCVAQAPKTWSQCGAGAAKDAQNCSAAIALFDPLLAVRNAALAVGQPSSIGTVQKKFRDLNEAYAKAKDVPAVQQSQASWEQAVAAKNGPILAMDKIAAASSDEEMMRYAAQVLAIAEASGAVAAAEATAYPKCSKLFPGK